MTRLHSLDPGQTVGYALVDLPPPELPVDGSPITLMAAGGVLTETSRPPRVLTTDEFRTFEQIEIWASILQPDDIVIAESFRLFPGAALHLIWNDFPAAQTFGIIRYICLRKGVRLHAQPSGLMKGITCALMKEKLDFSLSPFPDSPHEQDALRHALVFLYGTAGKRVGDLNNDNDKGGRRS